MSVIGCRYIGTVTALIDDGAVVYLNGAEAGRINMKTGTVGYNTLAATNIQGAGQIQVRSFSIPDVLIVDGINIFAVEVRALSSKKTTIPPERSPDHDPQKHTCSAPQCV